MKRIAVISCAVVAVVGVVLWTKRSSNAHDRARQSQTNPAVVANVARFEAGVEHVYDVSLVQTAHAANAADFRVAIDGSWAVAYAGSGEHGLVFRAQLHAKSDRGDVDARAYYFTTTPAGRLIAMQYANDVNDLSRGVLTTLAATFQVTRGRTETVETDTLGDYEARYVTDAQGLHRHRVRYQRVAGDGAIDATVITTGTTIKMRGDNWPERVAGTETTRVGTKDLGVTVEAKFTLVHRGVARAAVEMPTGLEVVAIDAAAGAVRSEQADRDLVDGATLDDLLAGFARTSNDSHAQGYQYLRVAALLRIDAEALRAAEARVLANAGESQLLVAALGEAGTPAAQTALGKVMAAASDESRTHAAISLGLVESPTPATLDALAAAAGGLGELADAATLAQGNAALRIRDEDPGEATRQIQTLLARFARATSDDERALVLRALGNSGDKAIVPVIEQALQSGSAIVRAAATEALRLVPGVDAMVVARFADGSAIVRAAAVFAAGQRDLTAFVPAFSQAIQRDPDIDVRRAIVDLAGARLADLPALRTLLEHAARHDVDADLRATAERLLAPRS